MRGLEGWEGDLPRADIIPAIRGPKDLDTNLGRRSSVPSRPEWYYLEVRPNRLDRTVKEYIQFAENHSIHQGALVKSNSSGVWFRQTRTRVTSRWALPYNSGYDYGAVDNEVGALLNGRLVGVEPNKDMDPKLLGAVLNSSFVSCMRLLEGVATGNEGAFDVGPPAVRVMRVPDPRRMGSVEVVEVKHIFDEILEAGILPPSPDRNGSVSDLRRRLDQSVLRALGETPGHASILCERLYLSYGRWRAAVEDVETQMRTHRAALSRRGGARTGDPVRRVSQTVYQEIVPEIGFLFREFSRHRGSVQIVDPQIKHEPVSGLFFTGLVVASDGTPIDLGDISRTKFAYFLRQIGMEGALPVPIEPERCSRLIADATRAIDDFNRRTTDLAKAHVSDDLVEKVVIVVRRKWFADSIADLRTSSNENSDGHHAPFLFDDGPLPNL